MPKLAVGMLNGSSCIFSGLQVWRRVGFRAVGVGLRHITLARVFWHGGGACRVQANGLMLGASHGCKCLRYIGRRMPVALRSAIDPHLARNVPFLNDGVGHKNSPLS